MRGKKSPMIMGLIGAMLLSTNAFAAVPSDFSDFPTDWSAPAMTHAVQNGLLNGSDGKILPKGLLTRAQMATMVNRAFASSAKASLTGFTDMVPGVWHYDEMAKSVQMGAFQGADGKLSPNDPITREQAFAVLARAFGLADGKASSLDKFSDGAQVSSWARGAVAALVEQGYVSGADGALNPQSYITRAEFAQVMDALVAAYADQDLKDQTVEGNLILRTNSTLENVTVKGDLILADGVSAASLKNVTVTGRLVVRGGTDGVKLTKSTAKGGIQLANPNGTPKLTIDGKAYHPNGTTNGGASNSGGGSSSGGSSGGGSSSSSGSSSSGGNSSTQTDLVVAAQTKLVDLGWGQYVAVRFTSGNDLNNCTLTVDGTVVNDACSNVTTDGSIVKWESTTWNPAKLVITKGSQSQTVTLSQTANPATPTVGKKADAYYFLANGPVYVWDYHLTNYDAAGKVRVAPATTQFSLTNKEQDAIKFYSPDAILKQDDTASNLYKVSGTVELMFNYAKGTDAEKAWVDGITDVDLVSADDRNNILNDNLNYARHTDYEHGNSTVACITVPLGQSNFYSNGRYQLRVTSNGTSKLFPIHVVNETKPYMELTDAVHANQNVHFRVYNMTYAITQPIYQVDLTDPNNNTRTLEKFEDWYLIGDSFILYNDTNDNLPVNGNYTLTVYADGFQKFTMKFNVNDATEQNVSIQKAALPYGIDTYSGSSVGGGSASSGSGSEGGSNTMNAYIVFNADLLANAEIMTKLNTGNEYATAIANRWAEMSKVSVYAEGSNKSYTYSGFITATNLSHGQNKALTFAGYVASGKATENTRGNPYSVKQVLEDNLLGEATSFSETANKAAPDISLVKLENDKYVNASSVTEGQSAMFQCLDKAYLEKLAENGSIYKGTASHQPFASTDYSVDTEKGILTISKEKLTLGDNSITIKVNGYQTVRLSVPYQKVLEAVKLSAPTEAVALGDPVTITCNAENHKDGVCDFFANVTSVELTGPDGQTKTVLPKGQEGSDLGYEVSNNTLVLCKNQFADTWKEKAVGKYTLTLKAGYGYETQKVEFEIKAKEETPETPPVGDKDVPAYESWTLTRGYFGSGKLCFGASGHNSTAVQPYLNAITAIKLGDVTLTPVSYSSQVEANKYCIDKGTDQTIYFYLADFSITDSTTITIVADGYKDFTLVIGADGKVVTGGDSGETPGGDSEVTAKEPPMNWTASSFMGDYTLTSSMGNDDFMKAISEVSVNGNRYEKGYVSNNDVYSTNETDGVIKLGSGKMTSTPNVVVIKATGYKDLTLTIAADKTVTATVGDSSGSGSTETPETPSEEGKEVPSYVGWNYYQLIFDQDGSNAEAATYLTKISKITIKNTTGETVLTESSSGWSLDATQYYKLNSGSDKYISFSSSAFSKTGDNIITIQADGYKDLTLTITNGNLKTDN
ncbi:MAG: hemoblobin-interacting domain-containing protein [Evtepia sp.]